MRAPNLNAVLDKNLHPSTQKCYPILGLGFGGGRLLWRFLHIYLLDKFLSAIYPVTINPVILTFSLGHLSVRGIPSLLSLAHQNRTIAIASDFRVDGAKSPEIPQKEGVLGSEIAARNRRSLATFHRTLKSQCIIAVSCLGNCAISGVTPRQNLVI